MFLEGKRTKTFTGTGYDTIKHINIHCFKIILPSTLDAEPI